MIEYDMEEIATYIDAQSKDIEAQYIEAKINTHNAKMNGDMPFYRQSLARREQLGREMDKLYILRERITTYENDN